MKKIILIYFALFLFSCSNESNKNEKITRASILKEKSKKDILERLKNPSEVVFIDSLYSIHKMKDSEAFQVRVSINAKNTRGKEVRKRYFIIYDDRGGDSLNLSNYELNRFID